MLRTFCLRVSGEGYSMLNGWLWETSDFALSFAPSVPVRENDRRLSPPVCWLIYCTPTRQWEINAKPSVRRQYNKWPLQTSTCSAPEGSRISLLWGRCTYRSNYMGSYVTLWENAAGHDVCRWMETTAQTAKGLGLKCIILCPCP